MIKEIKVYTAICDGCGFDVFRGQEHIGLNDIGFVEDTVLDSEWIIDEETDKPAKHYCPNCWTVDDNGEIVVK